MAIPAPNSQNQADRGVAQSLRCSHAAKHAPLLASFAPCAKPDFACEKSGLDEAPASRSAEAQIPVIQYRSFDENRTGEGREARVVEDPIEFIVGDCRLETFREP